VFVCVCVGWIVCGGRWDKHGSGPAVTLTWSAERSDYHKRGSHLTHCFPSRRKRGQTWSIFLKINFFKCKNHFWHFSSDFFDCKLTCIL
jgi:hypothetical protein